MLTWTGAALLLRSLRSPANAFNLAKRVPVVALTLGLLLWFVAFLTVVKVGNLDNPCISRYLIYLLCRRGVAGGGTQVFDQTNWLYLPSLLLERRRPRDSVRP